MFYNVGRKLKVLAIVLLVLGILVSLVYAIIIWASPQNQLLGNLRGIIGLGVLIGGSISAYLSSLVTYGIGEAAENKVDEVKIAERVYQRIKQDTRNDFTDSAHADAKRNETITTPTQRSNRNYENGSTIQMTEGQEVSVIIQNDRIICPVCGTEQRADRNICYHCAVKFLKEQ